MNAPRAVDAPPAWVAPVAVACGLGVLVYIASWALAGALIDGFDPARQAISETFDLGAPSTARTVAVVGFVVSALALGAFGPTLHVGLPGRGVLGPALSSVAGAGTLAAVVFPCSAGCPGFGTTTTDTLHVIAAGTGYTALILAPLLVGWRVRGHLPGFARVSFLLGGLALVGFLVRNAGVDPYGGLQQRVFNTVADVWYLVAAVVLVRRVRRSDPTEPRRVRAD